MKPVDVDPFPRVIDIRRGHRRTFELSLESGRFVARVPARAKAAETQEALTRLRRQLWQRLRREYVYDDATLAERAGLVQARHLCDLELPPWTVCFSRRQHKRWGSCTCDGQLGRIRISAHLVGHPNWVIDAVLMHELVHLVVPDHGPRFRALLARDPLQDRAHGYLAALEHHDRVGPVVSAELQASIPDEEDPSGTNDDAHLEGGRRRQLGLFTASDGTG